MGSNSQRLGFWLVQTVKHKTGDRASDAGWSAVASENQSASCTPPYVQPLHACTRTQVYDNPHPLPPWEFQICAFRHRLTGVSRIPVAGSTDTGASLSSPA